MFHLPPELGDAALANVSLDTSPQRQLLQLVAASGKYTLLHDRHWHTYWDDPKLTVLKRIENGQVVAQCNLASGPSAGKGRHQDLNQFRDDIRGSLKEKFIQFLGAGEVDGNPAGGFRYKVGVQGREGDLGVLWDYYLIANPEGDQLLATFTLAAQNVKGFRRPGPRDDRLAGMDEPGQGQGAVNAAAFATSPPVVAVLCGRSPQSTGRSPKNARDCHTVLEAGRSMV